MRRNTRVDAHESSPARGGASTILSASLALVLSTVLSQGAALAQQDGGDKRPPRPPVDVVLDANDDGVIDQGEIANATVALKKLDLNHDGKLTQDELRPKRSDGGPGRGTEASPQGKPGGPPEGAGQPKKPRPPIIAVLDANGDGVIDAKEIAGAPAALKKLDKNGDGRLSPDEYRPPRPDDGATVSPGKPGEKKPR